MPIQFPLEHMAVGVETDEEYVPRSHPEAVSPKTPHNGMSMTAPLNEVWNSPVDDRPHVSHIFHAIVPSTTLVLSHSVTRTQRFIRMRVLCRKGHEPRAVYKPHQYVTGIQDGKHVLKEAFCALKFLYCTFTKPGEQGYTGHNALRWTAIRVEGTGLDKRIGAKLVTTAKSRNQGTSVVKSVYRGGTDALQPKSNSSSMGWNDCSAMTLGLLNPGISHPLETMQMLQAQRLRMRTLYGAK